MAEQKCKLSGLNQPSSIHCPVTPVCVLQEPAVAAVEEGHMHSIAVEQERPWGFDIRPRWVELLELTSRLLEQHFQLSFGTLSFVLEKAMAEI
jgi:hypothetical protein